MLYADGYEVPPLEGILEEKINVSDFVGTLTGYRERIRDRKLPLSGLSSDEGDPNEKGGE